MGEWIVDPVKVTGSHSVAQETDVYHMVQCGDLKGCLSVACQTTTILLRVIDGNIIP